MRDAKEEELYPIVITTVYTGMRKGEVMALKWENVDFKERRIYIRQSLCRVVDEEADGKGQRHAYAVLRRKSYIEKIDGDYKLHQVIQKQVFAFCSESVLLEIADIMYAYMPEDEFSWFYPKYLKCKLKCIKSDVEFDEWWLKPDLQLLKNLAVSSNINGFEACFRVVMEFTRGKYDDSVMNIALTPFHIKNLIKLKCFKRAQNEANYMIRVCKMSTKQVNETFRNMASEFFELKAQALDAQKKYLQALRIREALCKEATYYGDDSKISRLHNLATSYQSLEMYKEAIETLEEVIAYREKHILEKPEDYIRALVLRVHIYKQYYEGNVDQQGYMQLAVRYGKKAFDEAHRILPKTSQFLLEVEVVYARLLMDLRLYDKALPVLEYVHNQLLDINQGCNSYIDEIEFLLATASAELGNTKKAIELFERLEKGAKEYVEGAEILGLRCKLEKGISISIEGRHENAKECLLKAYAEGRQKYGYKEKVVLELAYAIATEEYFLGEYMLCVNRLNEILPYAETLLGEDRIIAYIIKSLLIKVNKAQDERISMHEKC